MPMGSVREDISSLINNSQSTSNRKKFDIGEVFK